MILLIILIVLLFLFAVAGSSFGGYLFGKADGEKNTETPETGTKELQIRTDCDDHRIIYEGGVYATVSMDGKTLKIGTDILQIQETPYTYNVEKPKYPGMKVKLVNGSTVDGLKAGKPKTGDIVIYNDYMYVCNKRFVKDEWVVFNENEAKPEWGVQVLNTEYELVADMEDERLQACIDWLVKFN